MSSTYYAVLLALVLGVGCGAKTPLTEEESAQLIDETLISILEKSLTDEFTMADWEKITQLSLAYKRLTDVGALAKLTNLRELMLNGNQLSDISPLAKLTQLRRLYLGSNQIIDVTPLEKLTQLKELYLHVNQITDVTPLTKLTGLKHLELNFNPDLTKSQIDELQKALPDCFISSNFNNLGRTPIANMPIGKKQAWTFGVGQKNIAMWKGQSAQNVVNAFGKPARAKPYGQGGGAWTYMGMDITDAQGKQHFRVTFIIFNGMVAEVQLTTP
jgi:hypothetical protein